MYDFRDLHEVKPTPAELVLWGAIVAGPVPAMGDDAHGLPVCTGWADESPTVGLNKDGAYMATLTYRGADVTMMEHGERLVYVHRLGEVLKQLGTGWAVMADETHEVVDAYPTSQWESPVACFLDASRRALMSSGQLYESRQYLTITWKPPSTRKQQWYEQLFTTGERIKTTDAENRASFLRQVTRWGDALSGVLLEVRWLNPDETVTYLKNTVCWDRAPIKLPAIPMYLDSQLTSADFLPGHTPQLGHVLPGSEPLRLEKYLRPIAVKTWPEELGYTIPAALQSLPFPYRFTVRWIALDKRDGESVLRDYQGKWEQLIWEGWAILRSLFPSDAQDQAESLEQTLLDVRDDRVSVGYLTPIVTVWGDTMEELDAREREVIKLLQQQGLLCMPEVVNASHAWQGTLPGDNYHGVRTPPLPSLALAFLLPHATVWGGETRDQYLNDVPLFVTSSERTPFRYVLHPNQGEVGNFRVTGPTRRGKTAALGFMAMQFLRYAGAQVFCFDTDYQLYIPTKLVGGSHYDLGTSAAHGFHILGRIDESEDERRWAQGWLEEVFEAQGLPATAEEQGEIWQALARVAGFPAELRTLSTFVECFQVRRLKPALRPFLRGQAYPYFDAGSDSFALDWWTTFEMRHILEQPGVVPHAMQYVIHRLEEKFDGRPTLVEMDEFEGLMQHPIMQRQCKDYLKRKAKKGVCIGLSWQEIVDASDSPLWQAIKASCDTDLYLANDKAMTDDVTQHYKGMGLTQGEIAAIALARPFQDYLYKTKRGARVFQMRLSAVERLLCAASRQEEIAAFCALEQEELREPLASAWLRNQGYPQEADIFAQHYAPRGKEAP
jgi:type IV secretion/conjugal transfer VirB4 family ATPase